MGLSAVDLAEQQLHHGGRHVTVGELGRHTSNIDDTCSSLAVTDSPTTLGC
jgi:hypothetical protein